MPPKRQWQRRGELGSFALEADAQHPPWQTSPLFQLQVLFAFLQNSSQGVYNPEALVSSLKLDKGEQQDVQEFSKLFMSLLDHEFKKQGERAAIEGATDVSKLVQNLVSPIAFVGEPSLMLVAV